MNQKRIFWLILLFFIASVDVCMIHGLEENHCLLPGQERAVMRDASEALEILRVFELPDTDSLEFSVPEIGDGGKQETALLKDIMAALFQPESGKKERRTWNRRERQAAPDTYQTCLETVRRLLSDVRYFPVPEATDDEQAGVTYENSWQYERTYGGNRGHEGCDLMADVQKRGYYPVLSVSDGVVEKTGWLPKGGYRIGIRSPSGVYYYYAHLAEYEEGISQGKEVAAGELIGYMGDTGYSEVDGTTGNFPVHLHFGMYLDNEEGEEISYNPYFLLRLLEEHRLSCDFQQ